MFQAYEAAFEKQGVLRASALNEGLNSAVKILEQMYVGYSDGVVQDVRIIPDADSIILQSGVVLFQGKLYYLDREVKVKVQQNNRTEILKLRFQEQQHKDGRKKWIADVVLDENEVARNNEMELCRFRFQPGEQLRTQYHSFRDYAVEYNIVNVINTPYAAWGESTVSTYITRSFGEEMLRKELTDPYDVAFCFECQRGQAVNRKSIINYIVHKQRITNEKLTNAEIYTYLSKILGEPQGAMPRERQGLRERRMIII